MERGTKAKRLESPLPYIRRGGGREEGIVLTPRAIDVEIAGAYDSRKLYPL